MGLRSQIYRALPEIARSDAIVQRISNAVTLGLLPQEERLPPESELADRFGVAINTLREALSVLRELKIVETRRGRNGGTFVVGSASSSAETLMVRLRALSMAELRDLGDEHAAITAATVRLACQRAHPKDLERLGRLATLDHLTTLNGSAESQSARTRADSRFHIELAVIAQSERLVNAEVRLQSEVGELLWAPLGGSYDVAQATLDHTGIVEAIRLDDADLAQSRALEHIRRNIYHLIDAKLTLTHSGYPEGTP